MLNTTRAEEALRKIADNDPNGYFGKIALDALADLAAIKGGEQRDERAEFRHKKSGGIYEVICLALREADQEPVVIYRSITRTDVAWVRPRAEFEEKFEPFAEGAALAAQPVAEPIPMILHCPVCGKQHIDAPEIQPGRLTNPPHRGHEADIIAACGKQRIGVAAIQTKGKNDSPVADQAGDAKEDAERALAALELIEVVAARRNPHLGPSRISGIEKGCLVCIAEFGQGKIDRVSPDVFRDAIVQARKESDHG